MKEMANTFAPVWSADQTMTKELCEITGKIVTDEEEILYKDVF